MIINEINFVIGRYSYEKNTNTKQTYGTKN